MHVKHNTNIELTQSLVRAYGHNVAQMRAKHNTDIELRQSFGLTYCTLASLKCKQNTIQTFNCDHPSASPMVPWCCSNSCRTQNTHLAENMLRHHLWSPGVAQMRAKCNTNIELAQSLVRAYGTIMSLTCF
jgi:hypothetical protein